MSGRRLYSEGDFGVEIRLVNRFAVRKVGLRLWPIKWAQGGRPTYSVDNSLRIKREANLLSGQFTEYKEGGYLTVGSQLPGVR